MVEYEELREKYTSVSENYEKKIKELINDHSDEIENLNIRKEY